MIGIYCCCWFSFFKNFVCFLKTVLLVFFIVVASRIMMRYNLINFIKFFPSSSMFVMCVCACGSTYKMKNIIELMMIVIIIIIIMLGQKNNNDTKTKEKKY